MHNWRNSSPKGIISIDIVPLGGVNLKEFDKKFNKIWVYLSSSALKFFKNGINFGSIKKFLVMFFLFPRNYRFSSAL